MSARKLAILMALLVGLLAGGALAEDDEDEESDTDFGAFDLAAEVDATNAVATEASELEPLSVERRSQADEAAEQGMLIERVSSLMRERGR